MALEKEKNLVEQNIFSNAAPSEHFEVKHTKAETMTAHSTTSKTQSYDYEERVKEVYSRFATEAKDDFGKYLDDDDGDDSKDEDMADRKFSASHEVRPKNNLDTEVMQHKKRLDMCGLYELEAPPSKPYPNRYAEHDPSNQGALSNIKNKIKNFFFSDRDTLYVDADSQPRTIQAIQYDSSKIGYQNGSTYEKYYSDVEGLRDFDNDARVNNFKYNPNLKIAVMDDELNLHYGKAHSAVMGKDDAKKSKSLNKKLTSFFSKVRSVKDQHTSSSAINS